ncbi:hypothetical protein CSA37_03345 [Candidatus Fermentibacteria bacterium]|nr:MAG: hypothetical protein CSA37_03345 [Candidatus Fermentibacteria bacterium]
MWIKHPPLLARPGCGVGLNECAIGPDGSLYPCRSMYFEELNCGNVLESGFQEIWLNSSVLNSVRYADQNRKKECRDKHCELFSYCIGGCFGYVYGATRELKPWSNATDCYIYKQHTKQKLKAMINAAEAGEGIFDPI